MFVLYLYSSRISSNDIFPWMQYSIVSLYSLKKQYASSKYQNMKNIGQVGCKLSAVSDPHIASNLFGFHFLKVNSLWPFSFSLCICWATTVIDVHGTYIQLIRIVPIPGASSTSYLDIGFVWKYYVLYCKSVNPSSFNHLLVLFIISSFCSLVGRKSFVFIYLAI